MCCAGSCSRYRGLRQADDTKEIDCATGELKIEKTKRWCLNLDLHLVLVFLLCVFAQVNARKSMKTKHIPFNMMSRLSQANWQNTFSASKDSKALRSEKFVSFLIWPL